MKTRLFSVVLCAFVAGSVFAQFNVVANRELGKGYYPQFNAQGTVITYSGNENIPNQASATSVNSLSVDNADLKLNLYRSGEKSVLTPHGSDVNYVWSSLSPDGTMILFNTRKGTAVCDLQGREIINLGNLNAPVWYGSRYVVGMNDDSNGNNYTSSRIVIASIDGTLRQVLTSADEFAMFPAVNINNGFVAYNTIDGRLKVMKISSQKTLTSDDTKDIVLVDAMPPIGKVDGYDPNSQLMLKPKDVKIYINPGHGGFDSNDRNIVLYPFENGDHDGFWESQSNLTKALMLDTLLRQIGFQTKLSRVDNEANSDRSLSAVAAEANAWGADFMLSIHSNAGSGQSNFVLQLYSGVDADDDRSYPTAALRAQESMAVATLIADNLYHNQITTWSADGYFVNGDKSYANKSMGWQDGYGVLRGLTVPGCISEGSMHDYLPEAYRMLNDGYKYLEAWNFAKAFNAYFCNAKMPTGVVAGQVRDMYNKLILKDVYMIRNSRDELLPIHSAEVSLLQDGKVIATQTTDNFFNGVFVFREVPAGDYTLRVVHSDYYEMEVPVRVVNGEITYQDLMLNKIRAERPEIVGYVPNGEDEVGLHDPIRIDFSVDMLADSVLSAFSIYPEVEGRVMMVNSQRSLIFRPTNGYQVGTDYTVSLTTVACHPDFNHSNHIAQPLQFSFVTKKRPYLDVLSSFPADNETEVPVDAELTILFDRRIADNMSHELFVLKDELSGEEIELSSAQLSLNQCLAPYGMVRISLSDMLEPQVDYTLTVRRRIEDIEGAQLQNDVVLHFSTAADNQSSAELLNNLDELFVTVSADRSVGVDYYDLGLSLDNVNEGVASNRIEYQFSQAQDEMLFLVPTYLNYLFTSRDTLLLDVYGDFSDNRLLVEFSVDGDVRQFELCTLNYTGWRTHTVALTNLPSGIQYQFTGLRLQRTTSVLSGSGIIYLDALRRSRGIVDGLVADCDLDVFVLPNPVIDLINVQGIDSDCELQLFTVAGRLLRTCRGTQMSAQGLSPNTYILRISTPNGVVIKQILKR